MYLSLLVSFGIRHLDEFSALFTKRYDDSLTEREMMERGNDRNRERESHNKSMDVLPPTCGAVNVVRPRPKARKAFDRELQGNTKQIHIRVSLLRD